MSADARILGALLLSLLAALVATPVAIKVAVRTSFYDHPAGYKAHFRPTPYLGGAAVVIGFVVAALTLGQGLSRLLVEAMRDLAGRAGFDSLIAPVRPTWKERYPLIPMEHYVRWTRDDGLSYDPWLRVHARIGGELLEVCPESMVIEGTRDEWESWTGMRFPDDGAYVVAGGLVPVVFAGGRGAYIEPNVWMRHRVRSR